MTDFEFFATAPKGTTELLARELTALAAREIKERAGGVGFKGSLDIAYRACLWSRVANRVLLVLARVPARDADSLYAGAQTLDWALHLAPTGTLAVDAVCSRSELTHTQFVAQKVKDAVVDTLRTAAGTRPSVDLIHPDLRINVYIDHNIAQLAIDLSGESLHRRGYRLSGVEAPLKENLAATVLLRAGWAEIAAQGGAFIDPMCGSGTLAIEAALIAADTAPGLLRDGFGFSRWLQHDAALWTQLRLEASERRAAALARSHLIIGYDEEPRAVHAAIDNAERAGLHGRVHFERRGLESLTRPPRTADLPGLVAVNPPYGERLGEEAQLVPLYRLLGRRLRAEFATWDAAVLIGNPWLGRQLGIKARRIHTLYNGAIECRLLRLRLLPEYFESELPAGSARVERAQSRVAKTGGQDAGGGMFANRLRKNLRVLGKWAKAEGIGCFRLYDADMPEYALAIDVYDAGQRWLHVQEYAAPPTVDVEKARTRLDAALAVLPTVLELPVERIVFKRRSRQRGTAQYQKIAEERNFLEVGEGGLRFLVNLHDYLDTGLFLDHRLTRAMLRELGNGKRMLNLFAYTGTAAVYTAAGGARATTSIDMSATYTEWARRNLARNGYGGRDHEVIQADCLAWIDTAVTHSQRSFDLIFLDPPTFSNSKRMTTSFDVQHDHVSLIQQCLQLLAPQGTLIFSTNHQKFRLAHTAWPEVSIEDLTRQTLPKDFAHNPRIHQCWRLTPK